MADFDVTIFNVEAEDVTAQVAGAEARAESSAVSASQESSSVEVELPGAEATASAGAPNAGVEFVLSRNCFGGMPTGGISRAYDNSHSLSLWVKTAHFIGFQPQQMWHPAGRTKWLANWRAINEINPLALCVVHQAPTHNTPGFRVKRQEKYFGLVEWATASNQIDRKDVALSLDGTDPLEFNTNSQTSTTNPSKQAGWTPLVTNEAVRERLSDIVVDAIAGTDLTGENFGGGDVSDFMGFMHDGSDVVHPKSGAALRNVRSTGGTGSISTVILRNTQQPIILRLSNDLELATTGTPLAEDSSFEECVETDAIWFFPPGNPPRGFLGLHILGYKQDGARCQIYLKSLSNIAHETQLHTPEAGWTYVCNDQRSGSLNCDWNADGTPDPAYTSGTFIWGTAWQQYRDLIMEKMELHTGHNTVFGWSQASSHLQKRVQGLPNPHGQTKSADFIQQEEHENDFAFHPNDKNDPHGYNCSNTKVERGFRATHFFMCSIRDNPGGWASDKPRGPMIEWTIWGEDLSDVNELDASFLRFGLACTKLATASAITNHEAIEDFTCPMTSQLHGGSPAVPVAIEEYFIDFNTGWETPARVGEYDPGAGEIGNQGLPEGLWTWETPDAGERIFIRRLGNWLCVLNCADAPSGYNDWIPSHLPGGFSPRPGDDEVTAANWAQLYTDGVLSAGETLAHYDPSTYVNELATDWLVNRAPSVWTGYSYGPQQDHPADDVHVLKTVEWMARDLIKNDGSAVDTSSSYFLGPLEAVFLQILS